MQKKFIHFVGIDISKEKFDAALIWQSNKNQILHKEFTNNRTGIKAFLKWLQQSKVPLEDCLICVEHTGIYTKILLRELIAQQAHVWVEMSYSILHSLGLQRGKNDKIDATRIAIYAYKNADDAQLYQPPREVVELLRLLLGQREKLVEIRKRLKQSISELKTFEPMLAQKAAANFQRSLESIQQDIKALDKQLNELIKEDPQLKKQDELCQSVSAVGPVTSRFLICYTNEFSRLTDARQLACYCGVVPFEHTSGKRIRGKPKIHHMANKKLKKLLTLCARTACNTYEEFKNYKERKLEEGKHTRVIINNVRNKILQRICAVMKRQTPYEKNLLVNVV